MYKIAILMSTYNGNDYIKEQIDSIYNQKYKNYELIIRDDGSEKDFRDELSELQKQYGFSLILGENVGFLQSFVELLRLDIDADLFAFADQDDIWLDDKLYRADKWFSKKMNNDIPQLYHASYYEVESSSLERISCHYYCEKGYNFRRIITDNHYSGFSMVINRKLRDMMLTGDFRNIDFHDWWAGMITKAFGEVYYDKKVTALHRVHGKNVTTFNLKTRIKWVYKTLKEDSGIKKRTKEFERCFGDKLNKRDRYYLRLFTDDRYNLKHAYIKTVFPKRWRPAVSSEIVCRILMMIGRV